MGGQVRALRAGGAELVIALLHGGRPEDERLVILEVSRAGLQNLVASLCAYSHFMEEATPALSESLVLKSGFRNPLRPVAGLAAPRLASGLPLEAAGDLPDDAARPLPARVRLATTDFMARNLERMPRRLYDPRRVATLDVTMEELLARYLRRLRRSRGRRRAPPHRARSRALATGGAPRRRRPRRSPG